MVCLCKINNKTKNMKVSIHKNNTPRTITAYYPTFSKLDTVEEIKGYMCQEYRTREMTYDTIIRMDAEAFANLSNNLLEDRTMFENNAFETGASSDDPRLESYGENWWADRKAQEIFWSTATYKAVIALNVETGEWLALELHSYGFVTDCGLCTPPTEEEVEAHKKAQEEKKAQEVQEAFKVEETLVANAKCVVTYSPNMKSFSGSCKVDLNNLPTFYNTTRRSHKRAWAALKEQFTPDTTMYQAMGILSANGVRCKSYCAMD